MDFSFSPKVKELQARVQAFMDAHVYPNEARFYAEIAEGDRWQPTKVVEELKAKAKEAGLWNLFLPESERGARHRQHGSVRALRHGGAQGEMAEAAAGRRDPVRLRHDRAGGGVVGRDQYRDGDPPRRQ